MRSTSGTVSMPYPAVSHDVSGRHSLGSIAAVKAQCVCREPFVLAATDSSKHRMGALSLIVGAVACVPAALAVALRGRIPVGGSAVHMVARGHC